MKTLNVMNVKEEDVLNRNEMKAIMAGSGSGPNCIICTKTGNGYGGSDGQFCKEYDQSDPGDHCTWGTCHEC
jgi:hypothetical protein